MNNKTGLLSWLIWNFIVVFTYADGVLNITQFSDISSNLMWPLTLFIVFVSLLYAGSMFLLVGIIDYADKDDKHLEAIYYREPFCKKCDLVIDGAICLFLAGFGYFGLSFVYFGSMVMQGVGSFLKDVFRSSYDDIHRGDL